MASNLRAASKSMIAVNTSISVATPTRGPNIGMYFHAKYPQRSTSSQHIQAIQISGALELKLTQNILGTHMACDSSVFLSSFPSVTLRNSMQVKNHATTPIKVVHVKSGVNTRCVAAVWTHGASRRRRIDGLEGRSGGMSQRTKGPQPADPPSSTKLLRRWAERRVQGGTEPKKTFDWIC